MSITFDELQKAKDRIMAGLLQPSEPDRCQSEMTIKLRLHACQYTFPTLWRLIGAKSKAENVISLCQRNRLQPERVIEIGAGDGAILRHLDEKAFCGEMYALDVSASSEDVIKSLQLKSVKKVSTFNGYEIPYDDNTFDLLILSHVLEHVEHERILLREAQRVAKYQVIEVPLDFHDNIDLYWLKHTSYGHINIYTPALLRYLLKSEHFYIQDDIAALYSLEVMEYLHFQNNHPRTPEKEESFRRGFLDHQARFNALPREEQEKIALSYTVLTRKVAPDELLQEIMTLADHFQRHGQQSDAKLVLDNIQKLSLDNSRNSLQE